MATIDPTKIEAGPANIWFGVTLPGDGQTVAMTNGEPGSGAYLGATEGPTTFEYSRSENDIVSEQHTAAHDAVLDFEEMKLTVTAQQLSIQNLMEAMAQGTQANNEGTPVGDVIFVGGKTAIAFGMVVATMALRSDPTKFMHVGIYRARPEGPVTIPAQRGQPSTYGITWKGYAVTTYTAGQQLGYRKWED